MNQNKDVIESLQTRYNLIQKCIQMLNEDDTLTLNQYMIMLESYLDLQDSILRSIKFYQNKLRRDM